MDNEKTALRAGSLVIELSFSMGIPLTSNMGFDDFFNFAVKKLKLEVSKLHLGKVEKLIKFIEHETEPLAKWEQELLAALYERRSVSLCC